MICCYYLGKYGLRMGYPGLKEVVVDSKRVNMVVSDEEMLGRLLPHPKVTGSPQRLLSSLPHFAFKMIYMVILALLPYQE